MKFQNLFCTFATSCVHIWLKLHNARGIQFQFSEETITEDLLYFIKLKGPRNVLLHRFTKRQERQTGADWEWWFVDELKPQTGRNYRGIGFRVQAKIIEQKTNQFPHLFYNTKPKSQSQTLVSSVPNIRTIPLYCIYADIDDFFLKEFSLGYSDSIEEYVFLRKCFLSGRNILNMCGNIFPFLQDPNVTVFSIGAWILSAHKVLEWEKSNIFGKSPSSSNLAPHLFPLYCLLCPHSSSNRNLSDLVLNQWRNTVGNDDGESSVEPGELPNYVKKLLSGEGEISTDDPNLDGFVVFGGESPE